MPFWTVALPFPPPSQGAAEYRDPVEWPDYKPSEDPLKNQVSSIVRSGDPDPFDLSNLDRSIRPWSALLRKVRQ